MKKIIAFGLVGVMLTLALETVAFALQDKISNLSGMGTLSKRLREIVERSVRQ